MNAVWRPATMGYDGGVSYRMTKPGPSGSGETVGAIVGATVGDGAAVVGAAVVGDPVGAVGDDVGAVVVGTITASAQSSDCAAAEARLPAPVALMLPVGLSTRSTYTRRVYAPP